MNRISAVIITKNEELMIEDCLKSLDWVDEIVVIDTGSTDNTNSIAKKYKARIVKYLEGKTFSKWRNRGLKEASGDWILYVDADERITPELKSEILETINHQELAMNHVFAIPRRNFVLGKELKHGGWYPDYVKRLFKRSALRGWFGNLHEEPKYEGSMAQLKNSMLHIKHETFSEMVEKTNIWSEIEAKLMFDAKHPPMNVGRFLTAMWREFWHRMIVNRAFLDGKIGIMFALYQVFSRFVSYAKLWELQITEHKL